MTGNGKTEVTYNYIQRSGQAGLISAGYGSSNPQNVKCISALY